MDAIASPGSNLIEIHVAELKDLFNDIDPSPFREKDLDPEAEDFIVGWARDLPGETRLALVVLGEAPTGEDLARSADPPLYPGDLEPVDLPAEAVGGAHLRSLGRPRCVDAVSSEVPEWQATKVSARARPAAFRTRIGAA